MGNNKQISCKICFHVMRSDNIDRHMKQHLKRNEAHPTSKRKLEDADDKLIIKRKCNVIDDDELEKDMIKDN